MKVLRISHSGGVAAYRERERQLISRHSVELRLIIPEDWKHLGGDSAAIDEGFPVIKSRTYGTGNIPLFAYDFACISSQIKQFAPDLVDIHEEPYSVSCFQIAQIVHHQMPKAAVVFYSAQNIKKNYPPPFCWTERYVFQTSDGAYPCSDGVKDVLTAKGFSQNSNVIPLGVDLQLFRPLPVDRDSFKCNGNALVIGYFGRLEIYKGLTYVFEALSLIKTSKPWQLLIVGDGDFIEDLKKLATSLKISDRIIWVGEVKANEVPLYINLCDVVVVPSLTTPTWKEQFGRAVTEAMACGVPVVSSDSGSLPEVVGDAGIVVPEKDSPNLATAFQRLIDEPDFRKALAIKSIDRVNAHYTWQSVADKMYSFYERAVAIKREREAHR